MNPGIELTSVTVSNGDIRHMVWRTLGRGVRGARLKDGGWCGYGLAAETGESVLFKGDNFAQTTSSRL